jgi:hypothetical protein
MATRRRTQKVRHHFKDGGAVPIEDVLPGFGREEPEARAADADVPSPAPPPPPEPEPDIPPSENSDAVLLAIMGQRRAEQVPAEAMQRAAVEQPAQPAPPQPAPPQMSERRIAFIQAHPELLARENAEAVQSYWQQAQRVGMTDEAEVDRYVLQGVLWEQRQREPRREEPEPAPSYAEPPQSQREAFQEPPPEPRRPPPPSEPRRSMPMTAPPQREVPSYNGKRASSNRMRLTEEERMIARTLPDRPDLPKLTNAQKEYLYAQQKAKYEAMKASGEYTDQRQR